MTQNQPQPIREQSVASSLLKDVRDILLRDPQIAATIELPLDFKTGEELLAAVLSSVGGSENARRQIHALALDVFTHDVPAYEAALVDLSTTARKNFEPGGMAAALLFSRGIHAILGYRVTHSLWMGGRRDLALALKTVFGRAFSTDIHPAAVIGQGLWLDHGLGFVVGETTVIGEDVSIWHGVTLGSTLKENSPQRHPRIGRGVTIGADAIVLGGVELGENSVVAAGAIVLADVPAGTTVAGVPAKPKARSSTSFKGF